MGSHKGSWQKSWLSIWQKSWLSIGPPGLPTCATSRCACERAVFVSLLLVGEVYKVETEARSMCLGGWSVSRIFFGYLPAHLRGRGALTQAG